MLSISYFSLLFKCLRLIIVCEGIVDRLQKANVLIGVMCFVEVDTSVVNVLGYLPVVPGQLFGIDSTKRAIMISEDNGQTWMSLSLQRYTSSSTQTGFIPAKIVPWQYDSTNLQTGNAPTAMYTISSWGGTYANSIVVLF